MKRYKNRLGDIDDTPLLGYAKKNKDFIYYQSDRYAGDNVVFSPMNKIEGDTKIAIRLNEYGEFVIGGMDDNEFELLQSTGSFSSKEVKWLRDILDFIEKGTKFYLNRKEEEKKKEEKKSKFEELMTTTSDFTEEEAREIRARERDTAEPIEEPEVMLEESREILAEVRSMAREFITR